MAAANQIPPPLHTDPPDPTSPTTKKSFASVIGPSLSNDIPLNIPIQPTKYLGEPAISITPDLEKALATPFKYSLVGKFSHGRPNMDTMQKEFHTFGLKAAFNIGHLDSKHVLI